MILENTFTSIGDMVDKLMPLVAVFKHLIQKIHFDTIARIPKIKSPILFVRGMKDEIVPCDHTKRLYDAATNAKFRAVYECPDGDHNMTWRIGGDKYIAAFKDFFMKCE